MANGLVSINAAEDKERTSGVLYVQRANKKIKMFAKSEEGKDKFQVGEAKGWRRSMKTFWISERYEWQSYGSGVVSPHLSLGEESMKRFKRNIYI